jgi:hypothetical protein
MQERDPWTTNDCIHIYDTRSNSECHEHDRKLEIYCSRCFNVAGSNLSVTDVYNEKVIPSGTWYLDFVRVLVLLIKFVLIL